MRTEDTAVDVQIHKGASQTSTAELKTIKPPEGYKPIDKNAPRYEEYRKRLVDAIAILRERYGKNNKFAENIGKVRYENPDLRLSTLDYWIRTVTHIKPNDFLIMCDIVKGSKELVSKGYYEQDIQTVNEIIAEKPNTSMSWVRVSTPIR